MMREGEPDTSGTAQPERGLQMGDQLLGTANACRDSVFGEGPGYRLWTGVVPVDLVERAVGGVGQLMARGDARLAHNGENLGDGVLFRCRDAHARAEELKALSRHEGFLRHVAECLGGAPFHFMGDEVSVVVPQGGPASHCVPDPDVHRFQDGEFLSLLLPLRASDAPTELRLIAGPEDGPSLVSDRGADAEVHTLSVHPGDVVATSPRMLSCQGGHDDGGLLAWLRLRYGPAHLFDRSLGRTVSRSGFPQVWPLS